MFIKIKHIGKFIISKFECPSWIEVLYLHKNNTVGSIDIKLVVKIPLEFNSFKQLLGKSLDSNKLRFMNSMNGGIWYE